MVEQPYTANRNAEVPQFGMQALWRLTIWGGLATFALFAAVITAYSNAGSQRQMAATASGQEATGQETVQSRTSPGEFPARSSETAEETRRLAEAVRALAADRDQVLTRIAALERNLDGVTGTIRRDRIVNPQQAAPQSPPPNPAAAAAAPAARPEPPAAPVMEAAITPVPAPASQPSGASQPSDASQPSGAGDAAQTAPAAQAAPNAGNRAEAPPANLVRVAAVPGPLAAAGGLGVDVGGAANYEGLRTLWHATKNTDPALLEELYPVVAVRENGKTHGVDLRLVVGPIADAEAAARLCTTLSAAHRYCQPVAFEGQRLAVTDTAPPKAAPAPSHHGSTHAPAKEVVPETPHFRALIGK
jgi:hypothetical protein